MYIQETESPRNIHTLQILQHIIQLLVHVHPGNGKPTGKVWNVTWVFRFLDVHVRVVVYVL